MGDALCSTPNPNFRDLLLISGRLTESCTFFSIPSKILYHKYDNMWNLLGKLVEQVGWKLRGAGVGWFHWSTSLSMWLVHIVGIGEYSSTSFQ
jgi:hypothetical protein